MTISDIRAVGTYDPQDPTRSLRDAAGLGAFASGPDGALIAVWQDSRFSGGARDGIAFARSIDGGSTWSAPVQINAVPAEQALLPAVTVRADGTIGVLYYDMRNDTADPATLLVDVWLATSRDGASWSERHVAGPFDFNFAPVVGGGLFLGDYQGLASAGADFFALFTQTNAEPGNRADIVASVFRGAEVAQPKSEYRARAAAAYPMTPAWQRKLDASARRTLGQRLIGAASPMRPLSDPR